jgi:integrase
MAKPTELAALTSELKERIPESRFRFEWSSKEQGEHLLLCGDWNRIGRRTSRTLHGNQGGPLRKQVRPLSTQSRLEALEAATRLVRSWIEGADTKQRCKPALEPAMNVLAMQRRVVLSEIRSRPGGHGVKQKHFRHARALFQWLDERNQRLDAPSAIYWAEEGVKRNTDTYADRLRVAQWACEWNSQTWVLPHKKRAKKPDVKRPFVDLKENTDLEAAFALIQDEYARTFFRVIAATGCRPGEVMFFDWERWDNEGRPKNLYGYSPKVEKDFVAICNPLSWIQDINIELLTVEGLNRRERPVTSLTRELLVRNHSRLLKMVKKDLENAGWKLQPTWTDLRHMWTIRAEIDGYDMRTAALSQAHSHRMAEIIYLRHGEMKQVLAEIKRHSRLASAAV